MTIAEIAEKYVVAGYMPIPVKRDKRPLVEWKALQDGFVTKGSTETKVLFQKYDDPQIAIICGRGSWDFARPSLVVIDIDRKLNMSAEHNVAVGKAIKVFREICNCEVSTQGGGKHFWFKAPPESHERLNPVRSTTLVFQVTPTLGFKIGEVRSHGCYVLAPPSKGLHGEYHFMGMIGEMGEHFPPPPDIRNLNMITEEGIAAICANGQNVDLAPSGAPSPSPLPLPPVEPHFNGRYPSRSEKLMAIARRVIANGGSDDDVLREWLRDPAGTKIMEQQKPMGYLRRTCDKVRTTECGSPRVTVPATEVVIEGYSVKQTAVGKRTTLVMFVIGGYGFDKAKPIRVRDGVTEVPGPRLEAFRKCVGATIGVGMVIKVEIRKDEYLGNTVYRVAKWLPEEE